jgi:hypothetical protein
VTLTAVPDPWEDLAARVARLEEGAASYHFARAINDRLNEFEARLAAVERATPLAEPGPFVKAAKRTGPPLLPRSRDEASRREDETIRRAEEALREATGLSTGRDALFDSMTAKLDEILRRLSGDSPDPV